MPLPPVVQAHIENGADERYRRPLKPSNGTPYGRPVTGSAASVSSSGSSSSAVSAADKRGGFRKDGLSKPASRAVRRRSRVRSPGSLNPQEASEVLEAVTEAVSDGHSAVTTALGARLVSLKATRVVVDKGLDSVLATIIRVADPALVVDLSEYIATELRRPEGKEATSLGACLELLPLIEKLLQEPYEEYLTAAMVVIDAVVDAWKDDFRTAAKQADAVNPKDMGSINLHSVFLKLIKLQSAVDKLAKRPDAKNVHSMATALATKLQQFF